MRVQDYGILPDERVVVFIHGPNFFNAHRALGVPSADFLMLREFFDIHSNLCGIYYFNAVPSDSTSTIVNRIGAFLECNNFPAFLKPVDMIPAADQPSFTAKRLTMVSARTDLPDIMLDVRQKMRPVTLTAEIMTQALRVVLLSKARGNYSKALNAAIQKLVFIGGENDYPPFMDFFVEMGLRLTLIGLKHDSVAPQGSFIPPYAMVPYNLRQGVPSQFVDLSMYMPFFNNDEINKRHAEGRLR